MWKSTKKESKTPMWVLIALVLLAVAAVRVPFLLGGVLGYDAAYHAKAAVTILNGGLLYRDVPYTYPPLYAYTEALSIAFFGNTSVGWKVVTQFYDLGSIVLIYMLASRMIGPKRSLFAAALYGFSPLPLFATSTFASFDSTAGFWMLTSLLLLLTRKNVPSAVAMGIGTAYKYFPLVLLPAALVYLQTNRQRLTYAVASIGTVAVIQSPFWLTDFSAWLDNVVLYHINRPAFGASIYNLLTLHPQFSDVQTTLTLLSPISLLLAFLLVSLSHDRTENGLLKNASFLMLTAVFFNKVVLFYALWFIPLLCTILLTIKKRNFAIVLAPFLILQVALLLSWYTYNSSNVEGAFALSYIYLFSTGILLVWLLRDRLLWTLKGKS